MSAAVARATDYVVRLVPHKVTAPFISARHYAKGTANTSIYSFGLLRADGSLAGAALWMLPVLPVQTWARKFARGFADKRITDERNAQRQQKLARWFAGIENAGVLMLSRLVLEDDEPRNAESIFLGGMLRAIEVDGRFRILVTYADEGLRGHLGTIYRATNWIESPTSWTHPRWVDADGKLVAVKSKVNRTYAELEALGLRRLPAGRVHRFVKILGPR